jgi:anti-anti-sigma factor
MTASSYLAITTHHSGQRSVLRLQGELDVCTKDRLRLAISSALNHSPRLLVVDLSALGFMDCGGLSVLVWAHQRLAEQECQLLITGAQPIVLRLMHLTGLDTHLRLSTAEPGGLGHPSAPHMGACNSTPARRNQPAPEQSTPAEGHALAAQAER